MVRRRKANVRTAPPTVLFGHPPLDAVVVGRVAGPTVHSEHRENQVAHECFAAHASSRAAMRPISYSDCPSLGWTLTVTGAAVTVRAAWPTVAAPTVVARVSNAGRIVATFGTGTSPRIAPATRSPVASMPITRPSPMFRPNSAISRDGELSPSASRIGPG